MNNKIINFLKENWIGGIIGTFICFGISFIQGLFSFIIRLPSLLADSPIQTLMLIFILLIPYFMGAQVQSSIKSKNYQTALLSIILLFFVWATFRLVSGMVI